MSKQILFRVKQEILFVREAEGFSFEWNSRACSDRSSRDPIGRSLRISADRSRFSIMERDLFHFLLAEARLPSIGLFHSGLKLRTWNSLLFSFNFIYSRTENAGNSIAGLAETNFSGRVGTYRSWTVSPDDVAVLMTDAPTEHSRNSSSAQPSSKSSYVYHFTIYTLVSITSDSSTRSSVQVVNFLG